MMMWLVWLVAIRVAAFRTAEPNSLQVPAEGEGTIAAAHAQGGGRAAVQGQALEKLSLAQKGTTATVEIRGLCTIAGKIIDNMPTKKKLVLTSLVMEENPVADEKVLRGVNNWKSKAARGIILNVDFGPRVVSIKGGPLTLRVKYNSINVSLSTVPIAATETEAVAHGVDGTLIDGAKFYVYVSYGPIGDVKKLWSLKVGDVTRSGMGGKETFTGLVEGTTITVALVEKPNVKTEFAAGANTQTVSLDGYSFFFSSGTGAIGVEEAEEDNGDGTPVDGTVADSAAKLFHVYVACRYTGGKKKQPPPLQFNVGGVATKPGCPPIQTFVKLQGGSHIAAALANNLKARTEYTVGMERTTVNFKKYQITFISVEGAVPLMPGLR